VIPNNLLPNRLDVLQATSAVVNRLSFLVSVITKDQTSTLVHLSRANHWYEWRRSKDFVGQPSIVCWRQHVVVELVFCVHRFRVIMYNLHQTRLAVLGVPNDCRLASCSYALLLSPSIFIQ
jgi:hypothetical protein